MGFTYLTALFALLGRYSSATRLSTRLERASTEIQKYRYGFVVALVASLAYQLQLLQQRQPHVAVAFTRLDAITLANVYEIISILESLLLLGTYLAFENSKTAKADRAVVGFGLAALVAIALHYQNTSGDVLAYVGFSMLPHPYVTEHIRFGGEYKVINDLWLYPMVRSPYGPLWTLVSGIVASPFHNLESKIRVFQIIEASALGTICVALARSRANPGILAIVALNPFLVQTYLAEGHNDLAATALAFLACLTTSIPIAVLLIVAAGSIKITLAGLGMVAFVRFTNIRTRIITTTATIIGTLAVIAWGGTDYVGAIRAATKLYDHPLPPGDIVMHGVIFATALSVVGYGILRGRLPRGGAWTVIGLGQYPLPNYLCWGLPYAYASATTATFLVLMPYAGYEMTNIFEPTTLSSATRIAVLTVMIAITYVSVRFRHMHNVEA